MSVQPVAIHTHIPDGTGMIVATPRRYVPDSETEFDAWSLFEKQ